MSIRLDRFLHNGGIHLKRNHFVFTTIVDRNGFALIKYPFIEEYFTRIRDFIETNTEIILDRYAYDDSKIQDIFHNKYFKIVHPRYIFENWNSAKLERVVLPKTKHVFYKSISGALKETEEYHNGIVWFFGGFKMYESIAPMLNQVYLIRLNCDFSEICPELLDIGGVYDAKLFSKNDLNYARISESEQSREWVEIMSKPNEKTVREEFSEYMTIVKPVAEIREEQKNIPTFHDYRFEEYSLTSKFKLSTKRQKELDAKKEASLVRHSPDSN